MGKFALTLFNIFFLNFQRDIIKKPIYRFLPIDLFNNISFSIQFYIANIALQLTPVNSIGDMEIR